MTAARGSQRKNGSSRTLVLMATMRSSANDSQDQTISRAHLRQENPTSASDRPRFSRIHGVPTGAPQLFRDRVDGTHAEAPAPSRQAVREVLAPILIFVSFMTSR